MRIAFLGDTHGNKRRTLEAIRLASAMGAEVIVQTGDFGYWPRQTKGGGDKFLDDVSELLVAKQLELHWVDGNHEDHDMLPHDRKSQWAVRENLIWHPRGSVTKLGGKKFLWFGGAVSVDKHMRKIGWTWFPEEWPSAAQWERAMNAGKVDVMVTHDAPLGTTMRGMPDDWIAEDLLRSSHQMRVGLENIRQATQPTLVVHGHWHQRITTVFSGYTVVGLGHDYGAIEEHVIIWESEGSGLGQFQEDSYHG